MPPSDLTRIAGGTVYDPQSGIDGEVRDIWIGGAKIVAAPIDPAVKAARTIDAAGLVVMPGGVDMHCHIAGPKVNAARRMLSGARERGRESVATGGSNVESEPPVATDSRPRLRRGAGGIVPSTFITGYRYAGLGYTTAFDAAVPPLLARHAHLELADTPCIDKGFYTLVGNNHYIMQAVKERRPDRVKSFLAWLLGAAKGYAPKLVNPGGVEAWKQGASPIGGLDDHVPSFDVTPREIIQAIAVAANELALPHPVHIHCNNLGLPGNWTTTLETMKSLDDHRSHLTHIQFHSYGGGEAEENTFRSQVAPLAEYVNAHANLTVDVGQVMFGETITMTGDSAVGHFLHKVTKGKWLSCDVEMEAGCGLVPIRYRNKSLVHALQWAIGLEWYLLVEDPWRVVMSTDHPNGGSFLAYPEIIRLLMDRTYRADMLKQCPKEVRNRSILADLDREYTLGEIAIITRAGPARILGLANKGHLAPGADADITIYTPNENPQAMFELPRMVIKAGEVILENGEIRSTPTGRTLHVAPDYDRDMDGEIWEWINGNYTMRFENYAIGGNEIADAQVVAAALP